MTLQKRRRFFYALVAVFFVLGGIFTLYAGGWRFDLATFRLRKVGAIYVRTFPKEAYLLLDDVPMRNTSGFFQNGTFLNGLFPRNYMLEIRADGYAPWHEHISVEPALVSEEDAVLVPLFPATIASGTVKNFWLFESDVVIEDARGNLTIADRTIGTGDVLGATEDFETVLTRDGSRGIYAWNDIPSRKSTNISQMLARAGVAREDASIVVDKNDKQHLLILQPKKLSVLDTATGIATAIRTTTKNTLVNAAASPFLFAWTEFNPTTNTSTLVMYDKFSETRRPASVELPEKNIELRWIQNNDLAVLQANGELFIYNPSKNNLTKLADDVERFAFTKNGSVLAALEHTALEVFFFDGDKDYYRFNLPDMRNAEDVLWYADKEYLFVVYPHETRFLDLHDGSLENFTIVAKTNRVQYDAENNWFYFLDDEGVKRLDFTR
ncbi:MAG: hypothetical protein A2945_05135 [Candidatus Liptonbacteria bacterium RIFCSPLOWO2_01_FULL_52_25]|uniref:PEGA domain-containing protein n=1 Tax=Candidatus Liptonbacteria bacterium RIFCSPLOWO2_01_FULL_52_25 TaxID=1798650 RepID=A0A1G2CF89_9BACT|nr:MAG: hypothetical protein A2945_05135 [Candidatus Liptonbacteria bacterium RIFCSPLOWO2_01_FULL_52_25]